MKTLFIYPNFTDRPSSDAMQPLAFGILAALTGGEVKLYDERVEKVDLEEEADLVALSIQTFTARRAYSIADRFRTRGIPVVAGGFHPTLCPEEVLDHVDAVVTGDAEPVWRQVLEDAGAGRLRRIYDGDTTCALTGPSPERSIYAGKRYAPILPVQFGRGCRYSCDFCSVSTVYGLTIRHRCPAETAEEIRREKKRPVFFVDDNLCANYGAADELLTALIPLKRRWACQISLDSAFHDDLLDLLAESGCMAVFVGFESLDRESLSDMDKRGNLKHPDYLEAVRRFRKRGIMVCGSFLFGYGSESPAGIRRCLEFAIEARLLLAHFNVVFPTPGTRLYERLRSEGRMLHETWWTDPAYRYGTCVFKPIGMSPEDLSEACYRARLAFNRPGTTVRRFLDPEANAAGLFNAGVFWAANLISRREIVRKQGMKLG